MKVNRFLVFCAAAVAAIAAIAGRAESATRARVVVVMIWDGLRADAVTQRDTPNLWRLAHEGARMERHHAVFPTLTMVNAAALATGAAPGVDALLGNVMYVAPMLGAKLDSLKDDKLKALLSGPVFLESTPILEALNGSEALDGHLMSLDSVAQETSREGGYVAIIGKQGPTYLFDDRVDQSAVSGSSPRHANLFVADDYGAPPDAAAEILKALPEIEKSGVFEGARDSYFTRIVAARALPGAKAAADAGHPALVVFWQHNPDLTEHISGLGTAAAIEALRADDANLATIRAAIDSAGIADRTDLIVVSDHGFATIKFRISVADQLVSAGLKHAADSSDVVVAANGGADFVYLSRTEFPTEAARRALAQKIVDYAIAQEWCGPVFSAPIPAENRGEDQPRSKRRRGLTPKDYLGTIDGTFSQRTIGIFNPQRSPDLVISMREISGEDNRALTGPEHPAFAIGAGGQKSERNKSSSLIRPVKGVVYADVGPTFTTGMGMHGAAGAREIQNFLAIAGPDIRRAFSDLNPTDNTDVAPTVSNLLGLAINVGPGGIAPTGRVITEALSDGRRFAGAVHSQSLTATRDLAGVRSIATLRMTWLGDHPYLDDAIVERKPLGSSP
jgi:arylsulfatase A-like enzyme